MLATEVVGNTDHAALCSVHHSCSRAACLCSVRQYSTAITLWLAPALSQNTARADTEDRNCPSVLLKTKYLKAKDENPFSGTPLLDQTQIKQSTTNLLQSFWDPGGMT